MYLGIDIGGTKTLVASLSDDGTITESVKFPTPVLYEDFITELAKAVASLTTKDFQAGAIAAPGALDRHRGIVRKFGNLGWLNVSLVTDVEAVAHCPIHMENDAKLAALSEAKHQPSYSRVLYVTISTGIGYGLVVDGIIDPNVGDAGGRGLLVEYHGELVAWESFAGGRAITETYGKKAGEITDKKAWESIARNLTPGLLELIAIMEPEVVVIGGGAGQHLARFHDPLVADLKKHETPMLSIPPFVLAAHPEDAVIYGCYELAKLHHHA